MNNTSDHSATTKPTTESTDVHMSTTCAFCLPPEVVDRILALIRPMCDNKVLAAATLYCCALAGRELLCPAREHLYKEIHLTEIPSSSAGLLCRTLHGDPQLGKAIRTLTMNTDFLFTRSYAAASGADDPSRSSAGDTSNSDVDLSMRTTLPFHLMPELHTLILHRGEWSINTDSFIWDVISCLPSLEHLDCYEVPFIRWHSARSSPTPGALVNDDLPKLKTLCIRTAFEESSHSFSDRLLQWLRPSISTLQSLRVIWPIAMLMWAPVVSVASANLRSLTVGTADCVDHQLEAFRRLYPDASDWHTYVLDTVAQCPLLESLCVNYARDPYDPRNHAPMLLGALCDLLSRNPLSIPELAHLELILAARDHDGDPRGAMPFEPALRARFSQCLLDRSKYPRFRSLAFSVWLEHWTGHSWRSGMNRDHANPASNQETLAKTWRAAFSAFDDAPDVVLDLIVRVGFD
ncbi:hypothetical protein ONZ51_g9265 [Trametes cubensis]|uniref:Uncharacterized protein n=1 Tax=Trametes cubensis TaxID=1111947 RepID=A0AAD7X7G1_9APHY|nr:hypothetical protein ONZ51_g9265 [Trametes cubensis]